MASIRILGESFDVTHPYQPGPHELTAAEAKTLNQTRGENIGNNQREAVRKALADGTLEEFRQKFAEYDRNYNFAMPGTGATRTPRDPVEAEARKIAKEVISKQLGAETPPRKIKDIEAEVLANEVDRIAGLESVIKLAKKRVSDREKSTNSILAELSGQ